MLLRCIYKATLLLLLSFNCFTLNGQQRNTVFGFKAGLNQSHVNARTFDGSKSGYTGTELYGGFFVDTRLNKNLKIGNELLFSFTDNYHFIEVPLHLKYKVAEKCNILLGPKLDYIVDSDDSWYNFKKIWHLRRNGHPISVKSVVFC